MEFYHPITFITLLTWLLLDSSLLLQILDLRIRIWPPPTWRSWQFFFVWGLTTVGTAGFLYIAWIDRGSLPLPELLRFAGGLLIIAGVLLLLWSVLTLSIRTTSGLEGPLITEGPYRFSRNPQYVADILLTAGVALFSASIQATLIAPAIILWFLLAPFVEEPYLRKRFGRTYEEYMKKVPRFMRWIRKIR